MTRTEIYNIALKQHGKKCTAAEVASANPPYEVELCNSAYSAAVNRVLGDFDWSQYTKKAFYDPNYDFPENGWKHGYLLQQGILRIVPRSSVPYQLIGNKFLTNEDRPEVYAIFDTFDCESASDDFCTLIGLAIAYDLCGILTPANSQLIQLILQKYSWTEKPMIAADCPAQDRSVEEGGMADFTDIPIDRINYTHGRVI